MALEGTPPWPLTMNVRATCELKGPDRPPVPSRESRIRAGVRAWYVAPEGVTAVTWSVAVPVALPSVPVTVWSPATADVHEAPVQEPTPLMANVVAEVTSPRLWP